MSYKNLQPVIDMPTLEDTSDIAALRMLYHREVLGARGGSFREGEVEAMQAAELKYVQGRLLNPNSFMRVVRLGERCVGFLSASLHCPKEQEAYLGFLVIAPEHREQGWGSRLVQELEGALPSDWPLVVDAEGAEQEALLRFYERQGFEQLDGQAGAWEASRMIKDRRVTV